MLNGTNLLRLNFLVALAATLGSLYFGEVLGYPPCSLCWYQRICIYPLVLIFGVALWTGDRQWHRTALPLALIGFAIATYHNSLYFDWIDEGIIPCQQGVSCKARTIEIFGFLTIPLLSLGVFITVIILSILNQRQLTERSE